MSCFNATHLTLSRFDSVLEQIRILEELDFPYKDSLDALGIVKSHLTDQRRSISESIFVGDKLASKCTVASNQLYVYHRFLGYIERSASSRSSFEIYFSFRRLAESILGSGTKLIISSEWENYSPVNFNIPDELVNFVFIGMPVSEAENPFLVPLAGHELGHSIWKSKDLRTSIQLEVQKRLTVALAGKMAIDSGITESTLRKCEEYFCDFIALGIFGESFFYASAYFLAPAISTVSTISHPNCSKRAEGLVRASNQFGFEVPEGYESLYSTRITTPGSQREVALDATESVAFGFVDDLIGIVKGILGKSDAMYAKGETYKLALDDMKSMVPSSESRELADITNAVWELQLDDDVWSECSFSKQDKSELLKSLAIKSFEILEIKQRLQAHDIKVR